MDHGEITITVVKGKGLTKTSAAADALGGGDQVYLVGGDEFALLPADAETSFVVQMYWSPG